FMGFEKEWAPTLAHKCKREGKKCSGLNMILTPEAEQDYLNCPRLDIEFITQLINHISFLYCARDPTNPVYTTLQLIFRRSFGNDLRYDIWDRCWVLDCFLTSGPNELTVNQFRQVLRLLPEDKDGRLCEWMKSRITWNEDIING